MQVCAANCFGVRGVLGHCLGLIDPMAQWRSCSCPTVLQFQSIPGICTKLWPGICTNKFRCCFKMFQVCWLISYCSACRWKAAAVPYPCACCHAWGLFFSVGLSLKMRAVAYHNAGTIKIFGQLRMPMTAILSTICSSTPPISRPPQVWTAKLCVEGMFVHSKLHVFFGSLLEKVAALPEPHDKDLFYCSQV